MKTNMMNFVWFSVFIGAIVIVTQLFGCGTVQTKYVYIKPNIPDIEPCVMPSTSVTREDFGTYYLNVELVNHILCAEQNQALIEWKRRIESE